MSVTHSVAAQSDLAHSLQTLSEGLSDEEAAKIRRAAEFAQTVYADQTLGSGEGIWHHALGMALILAGLKLDLDCRLAALLFAIPTYRTEELNAPLDEDFGAAAAQLVSGASRLNQLRPITRHFAAHPDAEGERNPIEVRAQVEILRKMLLAMVEDVRVVLLRLASRTQTLRYYVETDDALRVHVAHETLALYSPLANRLGVWELKWELEDLSFRFLQPALYKKIAQQLDEKRGEREQFITDAVARLKHELDLLGVKDTEIYGRPKHIFSIWNKMRKKDVDFSEIYDVRALRVIVQEEKDCYVVLGLVHHIWSPISKEFDDYISNPKGNNYRSLHTAVRCPDGRALEVQIRTHGMHKHAELGIAAHWRYKEGAKRQTDDRYDEKIASLRQLLSWKDEVLDSSDWVKHYKEAALDETIYVMTPQGRAVDLPRGATPIDFAYRVHTDMGHRCRGAKVDGALIPLNTQLETGQCVEIVVAKQGGPSRDWLNPTQGYLFTHRARSKVRQWFAGRALEQSITEGRSLVNRELQRLGESALKLEDLANKLGFAKIEDLFVAVARTEISLRQLKVAARGTEFLAEEESETSTAHAPPSNKRKASDESEKGILIVGIDKLLTQLASCCKPAPPDSIVGFVTRGKGVSIHRADCSNFANMEAMQPERVIEVAWGEKTEGVFAVDLVVEAIDRQGLLRDVSEVLTHDKLNVIAVSTQSKNGTAHMRFTAEITSMGQLKRTLAALHEVKGVTGARRA